MHVGQNHAIFAKNEPDVVISGSGFNAVVKGKYGYVTYNKHDKYIGKSIEKYGEFSDLEVDVFRQVCQAGDVVIEVGANIGAHTLPLSQIVGESGRVYAYEPQRIVFQTLCANLAINGIANVECFQAAVCDRPGEILRIPEIRYDVPTNFGGVELRKFSEGQPVKTARLDDLLDLAPATLKRLKLIKADVEGMEIDVINSARALIVQYQPILYLENDRRDKSQQLIELLFSLGYKAFWHLPPLFNPNNVARCRENIFPKTISYNLLCVPASTPTNITGMQAVTDATFHPGNPKQP
jgi:FkbM family methyltransferase